MTRPPMDTLTVGQIRAALAAFNDDDPVVLGADGVYWLVGKVEADERYVSPLVVIDSGWNAHRQLPAVRP